MKIAVPSNDGVTIYNGMLGRAKQFLIFLSYSDKNFKLIEERENVFEKTLQHLKTIDVYNIINDCDTILSASIGKKGIARLEKKNVKLIFAKGNIEEQLKLIMKLEKNQ